MNNLSHTQHLTIAQHHYDPENLFNCHHCVGSE
ncbi:hypothetical protein lpymt_01458 [Legionella pneumophila]|nr:hypothetical protein lpymt_01458 [Legionella pneumophila]